MRDPVDVLGRRRVPRAGLAVEFAGGPLGDDALGDRRVVAQRRAAPLVPLARLEHGVLRRSSRRLGRCRLGGLAASAGRPASARRSVSAGLSSAGFLGRLVLGRLVLGRLVLRRLVVRRRAAAGRSRGDVGRAAVPPTVAAPPAGSRRANVDDDHAAEQERAKMAARALMCCIDQFSVRP